MNYKVFISLLLLVFSLSLKNHGTKGRIIVAKESSKSEEALEILNKQPAMSIEDEGGALYDCVRIYEQPAFDNSLLKNHKIQMKPTYVPQGFTNENSLEGFQWMVMPKPLGCPEGIVPIRRNSEDDQIKYNDFMNSNINVQHFATVRRLNSTDAFYGSQANMNILNPTVDDDQASLGVTSIWKGETRIIAGWAVEPRLYGDHRTRFLTFWRGAQPGCHNTRCPGFVQVDRNFPVDMLLNSSTYNERPFEMQYQVYQDRNTLNWWLVLPALYVKVGYWPVSILPQLADGASSISWGGLAKTYSTVSPPMGFGTFPDKSNMYNSGYFAKVILDYKKVETSPDKSWQKHSDKWDCYGVSFDYDESTDYFSVSYGGPGGIC